jgi:hypothetical protein
VLAILPATFISGLNLPKAKKIALCVLLSLGLIAAIFGGLKIRFLDDLGPQSDFTWNQYDIQVWTAAEVFVIMVCGNIPPLQLIWDRFVTHKLDASWSRTPLKYNSNGYASEKSGRSRRLASSGSSTNKSQSRTQIVTTEYDKSLPRHPGQIYATTNIEIRAAAANRDFV